MGETSYMAHEVLTHITGFDKLQRLTRKEQPLSEEQTNQYTNLLAQLLTGKPLQYVLGHCWFMGSQYMVNNHVLIPRPETEELVQLIVKEWKNQPDNHILDIGSGSGCIPISLKQQLPKSTIDSCDVSKEALFVAQHNATTLHIDVNFLELDFLDEKKRAALPQYDIIVSNPPYIPYEYKTQMDSNVKDFEPEVALFVPNDDPLLFYKAIAHFGQEHLKTNGAIYCELHADHAIDTEQMFLAQGYQQVDVIKDMHGNLRMLKAMK